MCSIRLDLEDAVELQILPYEYVAELMLKHMDAEVRSYVESHLQPKEMFRVNLTRLRGPIFDLLVAGVCESFEERYTDIMSGASPVGDLFSSLDNQHPARSFVEEAKRLASENVFPDQKKVEIELGSYSTFETLLEVA